MQKSGHMVLKGVNWVNWVHNVKIRSYGLESESIRYTIKNSRSNSVERSQLGIWYKMQKSGQYGLERSQLGTH